MRVGRRGPVDVEHPVELPQRCGHFGARVDGFAPGVGLPGRAEGLGGHERRAGGHHGRGLGAGRHAARLAGAAPAQPAALHRPERREHEHMRRHAGVAAQDVAAVGRPELRGELELHEAEEGRAGRPRPPGGQGYSPACAVELRSGVTGMAAWDGVVATFGFSISPMRPISLIHWLGLSTASSSRPALELGS